MTATTNSARPEWSSKQVLIQAAVCLLLGVAAGYFLRGPRAISPAAPANAAAQPASAASGPVQVTPEQLQHMAQKQAEPLLAELQSKPNDPQILARLGLIYYATHNFNDAVAYYKRSLQVREDPAVRTELGRAEFYAGDAGAALREFDQVLKSDPGNANALYNVGLIRWQAKSDLPGAIAAWQLLLKKNPNHPRRAEVEQLIARAREHAAYPAGR